MAKIPGFAETFAGRWRIVAIDYLEQRRPQSGRFYQRVNFSVTEIRGHQLLV
jgi:hypothetical protein